MKRTVLVLTILSIFSGMAMAAPVTLVKARQIAQTWSVQHNEGSLIKQVILKQIEEEAILYIFNFEQGWLMVSADNNIRPILGFSFQGNYSEQNEPAALKDLFGFYYRAQKNPETPPQTWSEEWEALLSGNTAERVSGEVAPLIPVLWNQDWPYNAYCPEDSDMPENFNGRHNTSCGPAAFAQILRYWSYPVHGNGTHSFDYNNELGEVEADFGSTYYNWNNMPVSLDFNDPEPIYTDVATLMYHCGVSVDEAYGSGASLGKYTNAAVKYFNYSPECKSLFRDDFTPQEWHSFFNQELDAGRPIMIEGHGEGSTAPWESGNYYGHYFICDGYYGDDNYHINWGWEGNNNGYFPLYDFGGFALYNWALVGLRPNFSDITLKAGTPYSVDEHTVVLLHFDGNFTNESDLSDDPIAHGSQVSFADNSASGLGQCLYLDNSTQSNEAWLTIADNDHLDLSGDWTIEMWFKPLSFGASWNEQFTLLNKPGTDDNFKSNYYATLRPLSDYRAQSILCSYFATDVDKKPGVFSDRNSLEAGQWYHFTYIRNTTDKTLKLVIHNSNGDLIHFEETSYYKEKNAQPLTNGNPLYIGSGAGSNTHFNGYIDELRISNIVRELQTESVELTLLSPNGGEHWQSGSSQQISWTAVHIDQIKLEYSDVNGLSWQLISAAENASAGSYNWLVPDLMSDQCLIRISDASNENTYAQSSAAFEIFTDAALTLITPTGGEYFQCGSVVPIIWECAGFEDLDISYSDNNGNSWSALTSAYPASEQIFYWNVPDISSTQCKIKIENTGVQLTDEAEGTFQIGAEEQIGGPFAVDENTILLLSFDENLDNKTSLVPVAQSTAETSFPACAPESMGACALLDNTQPGTSFFVPSDPDLSLTGDWTIEMWFYVNSVDQAATQNPTLINKPTHSWEANYNIHLESADWHMEARFYGGDHVRVQINTPANTFELNKWYHVAFINDVENNKIILTVRDVNLEVIFDQSHSYQAGLVPNTAETDLHIGSVNGSDGLLDGYIDELRISNTVRSFNPVSIEDQSMPLQNFILSQNYPNPFNPRTNIQFYLPRKSRVKLEVFNELGQRLAVLADGFFQSGRHSVYFDAGHLSSGVYYYRLIADGFREVKKMVLLQ